MANAITSTFDIPSIAKEVAMSLSVGGSETEYSKIVIESPGALAACSDTQEFRVLPYRDEEQFNAGEPIGGDGYQLVNFAARCHNDTDRVILTHDCGMPAISYDNGRSWSRLGTSTKSRGLYFDRPQAVVPSRQSDDVLIAFGSVYSPKPQFTSQLPGIYKSTDGGSTWTQKIAWEYIMVDLMYGGFVQQGYARSQENVLVQSGANSNVWFCATEFSSSGVDGTEEQYRRLFRSLDNGDTWFNQNLLDSQITGGSINWWHALVVHPSTGELFACTDGGLFKSSNASTANDGEITFTRVEVDSERGSNLEVGHVVFDPVDSSTLYLAARDYKTENPAPRYKGESYGHEYWGIYKSTDNGATWTRLVYHWRSVTTASTYGSYIDESTFSPDVDTARVWAAWNLAITPDGDDLYVMGGPNIPQRGVWLYKGIKTDASLWSDLESESSTERKTDLPGSERLFIMPGPTAETKWEVVSAASGSGHPYYALTGTDLTDAGYDASDVGFVFAESLIGWKGENLTSWHRAVHDSAKWFVGAYDVSTSCTLNGGNWMQSRILDVPLARGRTRATAGLLYAIPSKQRFIATVGGINDLNIVVVDNVEQSDYLDTARLAFFPGMVVSQIPPEREDEYLAKFPNEGSGGNKKYKHMIQNPDNVDWIAVGDSFTIDGGENWDYIPGLSKGTAWYADGGKAPEVVSIHWQQDGNHIVWAVNSTLAGASARTSLIRTTWSVIDGWGDWDIMPNIFGIVEDPSNPPASGSRMSLIAGSDLTIAVDPNNPDLIYAAATEGDFTVDRSDGHLWRFDYNQRTDSSSQYGSGLGGWTKIESARNSAEALLPATLPYEPGNANDNPTGKVYLTIGDVHVASNSGLANEVIYVSFNMPGAATVIRSLDRGATWEDIGSTIPCSASFRSFYEPSTGEIVTAACDGCYVFPAPTGWQRDSNIASLFSISPSTP